MARQRFAVVNPEWDRADFERAFRAAIHPQVIHDIARNLVMLACEPNEDQRWAIEMILRYALGVPAKVEQQVVGPQVLQVNIVRDDTPHPKRIEAVNGNGHKPSSLPEAI